MKTDKVSIKYSLKDDGSLMFSVNDGEFERVVCYKDLASYCGAWCGAFEVFYQNIVYQNCLRNVVARKLTTS